jgi:hypothetical protein
MVEDVFVLVLTPLSKIDHNYNMFFRNICFHIHNLNKESFAFIYLKINHFFCFYSSIKYIQKKYFSTTIGIESSIKVEVVIDVNVYFQL